MDRNRLGNFRNIFEEKYVSQLVLSELDFLLVVNFGDFGLVAFEVSENAFVLVAKNLTVGQHHGFREGSALKGFLVREIGSIVENDAHIVPVVAEKDVLFFARDNRSA